MTAFIFQGNPDRFDIDAYLRDAQASGSPIQWIVSQHAAAMKPGDTVYMWRSAGKETQAISGVVAKGVITAAPRVTAADPRFWKDPMAILPNQPRVDIDLLKVMTGAKEVIRRDWMKEDPVLKSLTILGMAQGTNYLLRPTEAIRLEKLVQNTGVDWSSAECLAALWLYDELYGRPISRTSDSPVAEVALKIGRAVSGVYNKLMNFRSIDPRDARAGLDGINRIDRRVWNSYFDASAQTLRSEQLAADYEKIWGDRSSPTAATGAVDASGPPEAPNDELRERRAISTLVRKGQPAFRKRLLHVYDGRCAISGVDVGAVLDAAHIDGYASSGVNESTNGLLLRSDLHDLFDAGLLVVDPETLEIAINSSLAGTYYEQFNGKALRGRVDGKQPSRERLEAKNRTGG